MPGADMTATTASRRRIPVPGRRRCPTAILCGQPGATGMGLSGGQNLRPAARKDPAGRPPTRRPCITGRSARRGRITSRSASPSPWQDAPDPSPSGWPATKPTGCRHGTAPRTSNGPVARVVRRQPGRVCRACGGGGLRVWLTLRRSDDELVAQVRRRWARSGSIRRSPPDRAHPAGSASRRPQPAGTGTSRRRAEWPLAAKSIYESVSPGLSGSRCSRRPRQDHEHTRPSCHWPPPTPRLSMGCVYRRRERLAPGACPTRKPSKAKEGTGEAAYQDDPRASRALVLPRMPESGGKERMAGAG